VPRPDRDLRRAVEVDPASLRQHARDLPFAARKAFELATRIECGSLLARLPDGRELLFRGARPGPEAIIVVHDLSFARRLASGGDIGFAEAYLRGEWDTPDLTAFLELFCVNRSIISSLLGDRPLARLGQLFAHWLNRNTKRGSRRNIHAHYDLGNRFYEAWLDPTMTYSSALFEGGGDGEDLSAAQTRKYDSLIRQTGIGPDHHVLEIGCGWGGFAEFAAKEVGCRITGLTISSEQFDYARRRMFEQGLADRVDIQLRDYRDERGVYDRIASIEMFEAVGEKFWPVYFQGLVERLKPGGAAGLQVITIQEGLFDTYRREIDFIRRYIFPGGMLPTPQILRSLAEKAGLSQKHDLAFGQHYAITLDQWRRRFREAWPHLVPLGFDERFRRMWEYYFAYCEAGFRSGNIDVRQIVLAKPA
jgi:cyclopropane-fatty-acyl-phospholipid synthase